MDKEKKSEIHITNNFNAPIGQHIDHVDTINFRMDGEGGIQFGEASNETVQKALFPNLPTKEEMQRAIVETVKMGLWWSSRSWAVVYRVYQMKGYMNGFTQFAREVNTWPVKTGFDCNYDAIQKPISSGVLAGNTDQWEANGAQKQAVKLADALLELLEKCE